MKHLKNNRGESYIDTVIKFMIFMLLLAFFISITPMFIYKINQDNFADELMRTAELTGNTNSAEVRTKYDVLKNDSKIQPSADWTGTTYWSGTQVQLNSNMSLTLTSTYTYHLGTFLPINIPVTSKSTGTSETFWK